MQLCVKTGFVTRVQLLLCLAKHRTESSVCRKMAFFFFNKTIHVWAWLDMVAGLARHAAS